MSDLKISKKSWSAEEDHLLLRLVTEYGLNGHWSTISSKMGNRTGKQCRERYHNHLKPDIWKGTWSQEEDDLLNESQRTMGNQWAKIARLLPGRSDNSVKNRWHIINRKKNNTEDPSAIVSTGTVKATSRPVIPKLSLTSILKPAAVAQVRADTDFDLMSFYYSHESHSHRRHATDSTRSNSSMEAGSCPGSGRRDASATASAPVDVFEEDFDFEGDDDTLASFVDNTYEASSFSNTLSSCMSELTTYTSDGRQDEAADSDSWENSISHLSHSQSGDEQHEKLELNIDRFSEPALSFRDMDSVLDDLARCDCDCDDEEFDENRQGEFSEEDDLFFLHDLMDECTNMNTAANASPLVACSADKKSQLSMFASMLQHQFSSHQLQQMESRVSSSNKISSFSPRTTPRSPLRPQQQQKRQRAGRTPRSPYQMLLQVM